MNTQKQQLECVYFNLIFPKKCDVFIIHAMVSGNCYTVITRLLIFNSGVVSSARRPISGSFLVSRLYASKLFNCEAVLKQHSHFKKQKKREKLKKCKKCLGLFSNHNHNDQFQTFRRFTACNCSIRGLCRLIRISGDRNHIVADFLLQGYSAKRLLPPGISLQQ